jgi:lipid-A-disaccharide synthase-like uncharacterized protein
MLEFSRGGENKGWGIYFEEELAIYSRFPALFSMCGVIASLVVLVYWDVTRDDLQGASGVASWMVSAAPLVLFAWHSWVIQSQG